jgi:hypothetical protein
MFAEQRTKLEQKHAAQLRAVRLEAQAAELAPGLGIKDVSTVLAHVDKRQVTYSEDGKATNLGELLTAARTKLQEAVGVANISSGLPSNPASGAQRAASADPKKMPRLGEAGLFKT